MRYTVGLIGYGYWGPILLRSFAANDRFCIKYVCDRNSFKLDKAKKIVPDCVLTNHSEPLFQDSKVDLIVIATQAKNHYELTLRALQAGKHVFVEKPFTLSSKDAKLICQEARDRSKIVWVDHTFIFTPAYSKLKNSMKEGIIGKPLRLHSTRAAFGLFPQDTNIIWHLMYHDVYLLLDLFQQFPDSVSAAASSSIIPGIEDSVMASFIFPNGLHATVLCDMLFPEKKREIIFSGDEGILLWDETREKKLLFYSHRAAYRSEKRIVEYQIVDHPKIIPVDDGDALSNEIEALANCLSGESPALCDSNIALQTINLLEFVELSLTEQKKSCLNPN